MTATALPCPFCGNPDPGIDEVEVGVWAIVCEGCGCTGPIEHFDNARQPAERAIQLWNKRAAVAPAQETWQERMARGVLS